MLLNDDLFVNKNTFVNNVYIENGFGIYENRPALHQNKCNVELNTSIFCNNIPIVYFHSQISLEKSFYINNVLLKIMYIDNSVSWNGGILQASSINILEILHFQI